MPLQTLQDELKFYLDNNPSENSNVKKMLKFLREEKNCFSRSNLKGHFTGSAWIKYGRYWFVGAK